MELLELLHPVKLWEDLLDRRVWLDDSLEFSIKSLFSVISSCVNKEGSFLQVGLESAGS